MLLGLISDTHSMLRAEAVAALHGVEMILHAGDVGGQSVLTQLSAIAPTQAVFGNVDDPILGLPQRLSLTIDEVTIHVSHGHELGSPNPDNLTHRYTADVIVFGHTHAALIATRGATLIVNPGAAGPRRFGVTPSVALLRIENRRATAEIVPLL